MKDYNSLAAALSDPKYRGDNVINRVGPNEATLYETFEQDGDSSCVDAEVKYMASDAKHMSYGVSVKDLNSYYGKNAISLSAQDVSQSAVPDPTNDSSYYNSLPDTSMVYDPGNEAPSMSLSNLRANAPVYTSNGAPLLVQALTRMAGCGPTNISTASAPASMNGADFGCPGCDDTCMDGFGDTGVLPGGGSGALQPIDIMLSPTSTAAAPISTAVSSVATSLSQSATQAQNLLTQTQAQLAPIATVAAAQAPGILAGIQSANLTTALIYSGLAYLFVPKVIPGAKFLPLAIMGVWAYGQAQPSSPAPTAQATSVAPV